MTKNDRMMVATGVIITIIALVLAFVLGGGGGHPGGITPPPPPEPTRANANFSQGGTSQQDSEAAYEEEFISPITITITLTWTDEADAGTRFTNAPDQFGLRLEGPDNETDETSLTSNTPGGQGSVSLTYNVDHGESDWTAGSGAWQVWVVCGDCGDQKPMISVFGLRDQADDSNAWDYTIEVEYYETEGNGGGGE